MLTALFVVASCGNSADVAVEPAATVDAESTLASQPQAEHELQAQALLDAYDTTIDQHPLQITLSLAKPIPISSLRSGDIDLPDEVESFTIYIELPDGTPLMSRNTQNVDQSMAQMSAILDSSHDGVEAFKDTDIDSLAVIIGFTLDYESFLEFEPELAANFGTENPTEVHDIGNAHPTLIPPAASVADISSWAEHYQR